jgi:integrase
MPPRRKTLKHLPKGIRFRFGAYHYEYGKPRKSVRLGKDLATAMQKWAEMQEDGGKLIKITDAVDRYLREISPTLAKSTFKNDLFYCKKLKEVFGDLKPDEIKAKDVWQFMDLRGKVSKANANKELGLLSRVYVQAIRWGFATSNPCELVKRFPEVVRRREVKPEEFAAVYAIASPLIKSLMQLALLIGQRRGDLLKIKLSDITEEGILITPSKTVRKTGKTILITWTDELRAQINTIRNEQRRVKSLIYLFSNRKGRPYAKSGIDSIWQRLMAKAIENKIIAERFRFHDLRSMAADSVDFQHAVELLQHSDPKLTKRVYRRAIQKVRPTR